MTFLRLVEYAGQRMSDWDATGAGTQRQDHNAERNRLGGHKMGKAWGFAQRNERKSAENRRSHEPVTSKLRIVANAVAQSVSFSSRTA